MNSRRAFLQFTGSLLLGACAVRTDKPNFDAAVSLDPAETRGIRRFDSLTAAIAAAPLNRETPYTILLTRGRWREKLVIDKTDIHLFGEGPTQSILSFDAAAGHLRPDGQPWGTFGCATLIIQAPGFQARQLRIENAFDYLGHLARPQLEQVGANGAQGVALMLDQGSDRALLENVQLSGHQDTLFVESGSSHFRQCRIEGSVDFIFGAGQCWLEACEIRSRYRPGKERQGYLAAPSTLIDQPFGLVFDRCRLLREAEVPDRTVALARAWRPGREFADGRYGDPRAVGSALFLDCWMDAHIDRRPWDAMAYTAQSGERVELPPAQARFVETGSLGPGSAREPGQPASPLTDQTRALLQRTLPRW